MSLIDGHWYRDKCIVGDCDEPPDNERDTCAIHSNVRISTWGSWLDAEAS